MKTFQIINASENYLQNSDANSLCISDNGIVNKILENSKSEASLSKLPSSIQEIYPEINTHNDISINNYLQDKNNGIENIELYKTPIPSQPNTVMKTKNLISTGSSRRKQIMHPSSTSFTSVHLLKSGQTYHSLGRLEGDKLRVVSNALKQIGDPIKNKNQAIYDPVTKTQVLYKIVYPEDLKIIENNKIVLKDNELEQAIPKNISKSDDIDLDGTKTIIKDKVIKVTRSGRAVKLPKYIKDNHEAPPSVSPPRKKKFVNILTCLQCHARCRGINKLQRHYENFPTHKPINMHTNLFECLLKLVNNGDNEDKTKVFIEQLEQLVSKLKNVLPCLLKKIGGDEGKPCVINEDLGRLFDITPGKYSINVDAINCTKNADGKCKHNTFKMNLNNNGDLNKPSQLWLSKHNEELATLGLVNLDCARTNSVDMWPALNKRLKRSNVSNCHQIKQRKINLTEENRVHPCENIEISENTNKGIREEAHIIIPEQITEDTSTANKDRICTDQSNKTLDSKIHILNEVIFKNHVIQNNTLTQGSGSSVVEDTINSQNVEHCRKQNEFSYHSLHFNIRSSPIKSSNTVFSKINIKRDDLASFVKLTEQNIPHENLLHEIHEEKTDKTNGNTSGDTTKLDINGILSELNSSAHTSHGSLQHTEENSQDKNGLCNMISHYETNMVSPHNSKDKTLNHNAAFDSNNLLHIPQTSMGHSDSILTMEANQNDHLLSVNDPSIGTSVAQSVLQLLDPLGNDCLAFSDSDLRSTSLDLPLDLFQFHHGDEHHCN